MTLLTHGGPSTAAPTTSPPRDPPRWWQAAPVDAPNRKRIGFEILAMLLLIAVPGLLVGLEGITDPASIDVDEIGGLELAASVAGSFGGALMAVHLLWRDGLLAQAGFHRRSPGFVLGYGALGTVCCYAAVIGAAILSLAIFAGFGGDPESVTDDRTGGDIELTVGVLVVAYVLSITAGITEEIVFRAYAITRLEQLGWGRWAAVAAGGVFTLLHLYQGVFAVFVIGAITAVFTWLYKWKRTLLPLVVAHAAYDAIQLTIAILVSS